MHLLNEMHARDWCMRGGVKGFAAGRRQRAGCWKAGRLHGMVVRGRGKAGTGRELHSNG